MEDLINTHLAELESNLNTLKSSIEYINQAKLQAKEISDAASKVVESISGLNKEYVLLRDTNNKLLDRIDKIDFPSRLEKLDLTVSTINNNISSILNRIESLERNIKDETKNRSKDILTGIESNNKSIIDASLKELNAIKTNKYIYILLSIIIILLLILNYFK